MASEDGEAVKNYAVKVLGEEAPHVLPNSCSGLTTVTGPVLLPFAPFCPLSSFPLVPPWIAREDPLGEFAVKEVKTRVNSTVVLECETWAVPEPTIRWYKDKQVRSQL